MKTSRIIIAFLTLLCVLPSAAQVKWLATRHNFGAFSEDMGSVECRFRFVNTGKEPVTIITTHASCGCTAPIYDRGAVAPGDTSSILVTFNPAGRPGHFEKYVAINFSNGQRRMKLYIEGTVIGSKGSVAHRFPVECCQGVQLARGLVLAGEVTKGQLRPVYLDAYNRSTDTIMPVVTDMPPYVNAEVSPSQVPPGQQFTFIFYFNSARCPVYGAVSDTLRIAAGDGSGRGCDIPLAAIVNEDFSGLSDSGLKKAPVAAVSSTQIDFGRLGDEMAVRTFDIENKGKSPLKIRRVHTPDAGVTVAVASDTVGKGDSETVTVTVDPACLKGGMLNARINVITNDPSNPTIVVRAVGELKGITK